MMAARFVGRSSFGNRSNKSCHRTDNKRGETGGRERRGRRCCRSVHAPSTTGILPVYIHHCGRNSPRHRKQAVWRCPWHCGAPGPRIGIPAVFVLTVSDRRSAARGIGFYLCQRVERLIVLGVMQVGQHVLERLLKFAHFVTLLNSDLNNLGSTGRLLHQPQQ